MTDDLGELAWHFLSAFQAKAPVVANQGLGESLAMESSRIAALTSALGTFTGTDPAEVCARALPFKSLSVRGMQAGTDPLDVHNGVYEQLDGSTGGEYATRISALPVPRFMELLSRIHSLGTHFFGRKITSRRVHGTYYTPWTVAEHMAERVLGPSMDSLIGQAKRDSTSLKPMLSWRVLDPACGPGVFLVSCLGALMRRERDLAVLLKQETPVLTSSEFLRSFSMSLYGVDTDAGSLEIADVCLELLLGEKRYSGPVRTGLTLKAGNSLVSAVSLGGARDMRDVLPVELRAGSFDWYQQFAPVFSGPEPGFDFVVMNPPYDRIKPDFAQFLRDHLVIGNRTIQMAEFDQHSAAIKASAVYFRRCGEYPLSGTNTIDLHRLFIERSLKLTRDGGRLGFIVPSSILGDISATQLRCHLIEQNRVESLDEFREGTDLFPGVTQSVCIMTVQKGGTTGGISAAFGLSDARELSGARRVTIKPDMIRSSFGRSLPIPSITQEQWRIVQRLHRNASLGTQEWVANHRGELDLTLDRQFITRSGGDTYLVRGTHLDRFGFSNTPRDEWVDLDGFLRARGKSSRTRDIRRERLACQQVSNRLQRWRLKFALILPGSVLANSCNYIVVDCQHPSRNLRFLLGLMNSSLINWRFGLTNTNNHVSNRELSQLPVIDPDSVKGDAGDLVDEVIAETKRLQRMRPSITSHLDALIFRLFGLTKNEARSVLGSVGASADEVAETSSLLTH